MKGALFLILSLMFLIPQTISLAQTTDKAPMEVAGARAAAKSLFNKELPFVDMRSKQDFNSGHIPGAKHLAVHDKDLPLKIWTPLQRKGRL